jgi:hypothetical protein
VIRKSLKVNPIVEKLKPMTNMLLSSYRTKKKKKEDSEVLSMKSPRVSRNQTDCLLEAPRQSNFDIDDSVNTHPRRATGAAKAEINLRIRYKFGDIDKAPRSLHVQFLHFMIININFNIIAYNKNQEALKVTDIMSLTDTEKYKNNFIINISKKYKHEETKQAVIIQPYKATQHYHSSRSNQAL